MYCKYPLPGTMSLTGCYREPLGGSHYQKKEVNMAECPESHLTSLGDLKALYRYKNAEVPRISDHIIIFDTLLPDSVPVYTEKPFERQVN